MESDDIQESVWGKFFSDEDEEIKTVSDQNTNIKHHSNWNIHNKDITNDITWYYNKQDKDHHNFYCDTADKYFNNIWTFSNEYKSTASGKLYNYDFFSIDKQDNTDIEQQILNAKREYTVECDVYSENITTGIDSSCKFLPDDSESTINKINKLENYTISNCTNNSTRLHCDSTRVRKNQKRRNTPRSKENKSCTFCNSNSMLQSEYKFHTLRDIKGRVCCPILRNFVCGICKATGDYAHVERYCPKRKTVCVISNPKSSLRIRI